MSLDEFSVTAHLAVIWQDLNIKFIDFGFSI